MDNYEIAMKIMEKLFSRDYQFAMATTTCNAPSLRFIDVFYDKAAFYIVTYSDTRKVKEITINPNVVLCSRRGYSFKGKAFNIGHPLLLENSDIRNKLIKAFESWYFKHNNENEDICVLKIELENGYIHKDGMGYNINFIDKTVNAVPFKFDIVLTDE